MLIAAGLVLAGLVVLVLGAELLTRGGASVAKRLGLPPIVIGLTVIAIGTSTPELAVGIGAALKGNGALAVGNVAGTNVVNILLILGGSALIRPIVLGTETLRLDVPAMLLATLAMLALSADGELSRLDGAILVALGVVYTVLVARAALRERRAIRRRYAETLEAPEPPGSRGRLVRNAAMLAAGIALAVAGAEWFVDGAVALARLWGVTDAFIGLTVVAIGTSAPEIVTTVVATLRGQRDLAIGNLLGSSVYNIVFILGATCLVPSGGIPVTPNLVSVDLPVLTAIALVSVPVFLTGRQVSRIEGGLFVAGYAVYLGYLILMRT